MRRSIWFLALTAAAGPGPPGLEIRREGAYFVQVEEGSLSATGLQALSLRSCGDIAAEGVDTERISYSLRKRARTADEGQAERVFSRIRLTERREDSGLRAVVECSHSSRLQVEVTVKVPRRLPKVRLETLGGGIDARSLDGMLVAASGGGRIYADGIGRGLEAETAGGEVHLGRIDGSARCVSGAGGIRVERVGGLGRFETAGGEIRIGEALGPVRATTGGGNIRVGRAAAGVTARTSGGVIEVGDCSGEVIAHTAGGAIEVQSARGVRAQSAGGAIRLAAAGGSVRASTAWGDIVAELARDARLSDSFLETSFGDVTVLIPSNLAVTVKARNVAAGRGGRIVTEFPEIRVHQHAERVFEPAWAEGAINGGGPVLSVAAAGGTIYLRRR